MGKKFGSLLLKLDSVTLTEQLEGCNCSTIVALAPMVICQSEWRWVSEVRV